MKSILAQDVLVEKTKIPADLLEFFEPAECGHCFICMMVSVFREVFRVLRDDATCWINLGDSFGSGKQLQGIPWRVAMALQADGWILRSDIVWSKNNPMPESVTDRPTKSHEYMFLLSKQERYYFDADAVREDGEGYGRGTGPGAFRSAKYQNNASFDNDAVIASNGVHGHSFEGGRNIRTVWSIPTESYPGSHFATFPRKLVEPCIKAGTSERGCCSAIVPKLRLKRDLTPERLEQVTRYLKSKRLVP